MRPPKPRFPSPIRGPWLTSVLGAVLLLGLPVVTVTGLLSWMAYGPQFPGNASPADVGGLRLPLFAWPTSPSWLYRLTQGVHVVLGLTLVPIVLGKLWSVVPKLFVWPPARSVLSALERLTLVMLVGGVLFEIVTGVLNIQYDYVFGFDFYTAHYYGAWVFVAGLAAHLVLKLPLMVATLRSRPLLSVLREDRAATRPEPRDDVDAAGLVPVDPSPATTSRRGALALVGGGALLLFLGTVGSTLSDRLRRTAVFSPRGRSGTGPTGFPVNKTAAGAGITAAVAGPDWRLRLSGPGGPTEVSRQQLLAMPQSTARLPISCVEGWSTTQTWTGVRLADLARLAGAGASDGGIGTATVRSLEQGSPYSVVGLHAGQVRDPDSLLALRVNGVDLTPDHGFPARVIVPAIPGVHATKWVAALEFRDA